MHGLLIYHAGCPTILRADKGTENVLAGSAQIALRLNHADQLAGAKSFLTGASVHNVVSNAYTSHANCSLFI